jgi:hypothetical protein
MGYYLAYLGVPDLGHPKIPNNKAATLKKNRPSKYLRILNFDTPEFIHLPGLMFARFVRLEWKLLVKKIEIQS